MYSSLEPRSISLKRTRRSGAASRGRSKLILGGQQPSPAPGKGPLERLRSPENLGGLGLQFFCAAEAAKARRFVVGCS